MAGLFIPLDVNYADDSKIIDAGPLAELLFVRSLAFAKRSGSDGHISTGQLSTIAARIPQRQRHTQRLLEVGLWEQNGAGLLIRAWAKRNPPAAVIAEQKSTAGIIGNHRRWHLGSDGTPNPGCEICVAEHLA
jgi:hypothetical protein